MRSNLPRLVRHLRTLPATRWEVVVVDNGSTDGTQAVVRELQAQYREVSLLVQAKRGRGNAIQMAWRASQAGVHAYMDADLAVDVAHITDLVEPLLDGRADVVYGNRFDAQSTVERSRLREWLSRGYRLVARAMLGPEIQDFQCGFKAIRAACRDDLLGEIRDGHWFFDTELLVRATTRGLRVRGIPIRWRDRDETRVSLTATSLSNVFRLVSLRRELARQPRPGRAAKTSRRAPPTTTASTPLTKQGGSKPGLGFTLIELLATLAIIALLAAWLLPSLFEAKRKGGRIQCLNHLRQLQLAYLTYTDDHTQRLPSNGCRPDAEGHWRSTARAWCGPSAAPIDADATAIKAGVLFRFPLTCSG